MKSKIVLLVMAMAFKTLFLFVITLLFTRNIVSYTEYISHTSSITLLYCLYLMVCEIFTILLIKKLSEILFVLPDNTIKRYIGWLILFFFCFFCIDFFFTIEIQSKKIFHHIICAISIATKYVIIYFIVATATLKIDPNQAPIIKEEIFRFGISESKWVNKKIFNLFSSLIYSKYKFILFGGLLILVNIASMNFYTPNFILYIIMVVLIPFLFYSILIQVHQVNTVMKLYKRFSKVTGIDL